MSVTEAATKVAASLVTVPTLLVMVLLNVALIGAAAWFLNQQEQGRVRVTTELVKLITSCLDQKHDRKAEPP